MALYTCSASECKKTYPTDKALKIHRRRCTAAATLLQNTGTRFKEKLEKVRKAKIQRCEKDQDLTQEREVLRQELDVVCGQ